MSAAINLGRPSPKDQLTEIVSTIQVLAVTSVGIPQNARTGGGIALPAANTRTPATQRRRLIGRLMCVKGRRGGLRRGRRACAADPRPGVVSGIRGPSGDAVKQMAF